MRLYDSLRMEEKNPGGKVCVRDVRGKEGLGSSIDILS